MSEGILDILSLTQGGPAVILENPYVPISYPLALPTSPGFRRLRMLARFAVSQSQSPFTYDSQFQRFQGEYWQAEVTLPPLTREQADEWVSVLLSLRGPVGTFRLGDPLGASPRGSAMGSPKVFDAAQSGDKLTTYGWTPNQSGLLRPGDYVQVGDRLYRNLRIVSSGSTGIATLDIWPRLRESPAVDTPLILTETKGLFRLANAEYDLSEADETRLYSVSFSCVEAF